MDGARDRSSDSSVILRRAYAKAAPEPRAHARADSAEGATSHNSGARREEPTAEDVRSNAATEGGEEEAETGDDPFGSAPEGADRPSDFGLPSDISDISGFSSLSSRTGLGFGPQTRD